MKTKLLLIFLFIFLIVALTAKEKFKIESPSFKNGNNIPMKFTCDKENISPEIRWYNEPDQTKSLVLICDDPDAPVGVWVHWVVYNINPNLSGIPENYISQNNLKMTEGKTDFGSIGWGGPCPPNGKHRYFFKLYAVDIETNYPEGLTKAQILEKIKHHTITETSFYGTYERTK